MICAQCHKTLTELEQETSDTCFKCMKTDKLPCSNFKDHEIQKIVNDLRDITIKYKDCQQLREQIHSYIVPILKGE